MVSNDSRGPGFPLVTASDSPGHSVTLNPTPNPTSAGLGQYAVGTFTADATSEVITFSGSENFIGWVNGLQLRNLGPAATGVPEPSTLTLLGMGAVCSVGYGWRRRKQPVTEPMRTSRQQNGTPKGTGSAGWNLAAGLVLCVTSLRLTLRLCEKSVSYLIM